MKLPSHTRLVPLLLVVEPNIAVACSSGDGDPGPATSGEIQSPVASRPQGLSDRFAENLHGWQVISDELEATLATPDVAVTGPQRIAVVLSDGRGIIRFPIVRIESYRYPDGFQNRESRQGPVEAAQAVFNEFPFATRGIHVTELRFDTPGDWSIVATVPKPDGTFTTAEILFEVGEKTVSIDRGQPAPPSVNRTLSDVNGVQELTTGSFNDPDLYRLTIADALEVDRPLVITFASPAFCTNAVCGPQVEVLSEAREEFGDRADFIHVDLFENPREIQGDLSKAIETPLLDEWGLVSQEWTYVVGGDGLVSARFENFVGISELTSAIDAALDQG